MLNKSLVLIVLHFQFTHLFFEGTHLFSIAGVVNLELHHDFFFFCAATLEVGDLAFLFLNDSFLVFNLI